MKVKAAKKGPEKIVMRTKAKDDMSGQALLSEWWKAEKDSDLAAQLTGTAAYLKTAQQYRLRQLASSVRLYAGLNVYSYAGSNISQLDRTRTLPDDRPTFNLIQACTDTLVSRIGQDKPEPKFLTDGADYEQRHLAEQLNQFILGEFYQTKAYDKMNMILRDAIVMGTGCLKVFGEPEKFGGDGKVHIERVMATDLYVDDNDAVNGKPQGLIQLQLMDREKLLAMSPKKAHKAIESTPQSYPDNAPSVGKTTADQVMVVEGWRLPVGEKGTANYIPGRHVIATVGGVLLDEEWHKQKFPFVFIKYSDPYLGFWGQGLGAQLFGTQLTLNRILYTIAQSITLVGVPRVFIEQNSKVSKTAINNQLGVICTFTGTKPSYEVAPCNAPELYQERDRLIQYGFQQCGVSMMQSTSQKPAGLNSGEAIRSYDDISTDRMATLSNKFSEAHKELAYLITDEAKDIAEIDGKYQTVYPNKDGTKEIDLPKAKLLDDPFVIQCFNESSLPRTPAGRIEKVTEQVQAGMLTIKEGRRLMRFPDLEQNERLDNASEERIFKMLDAIVKDGKYTAPDSFLDLQLATTLCVQYINLYLAANLPEKRANMLRTWFKQVQALQQQAVMAMMPPPGASPQPTASPQPPPTSPLVPNTPNNPQQMAS